MHAFCLWAITVNSEINVCIYYCDSLTTIQNTSLIFAISLNIVTKGYWEIIAMFSLMRIMRHVYEYMYSKYYFIVDN